MVQMTRVYDAGPQSPLSLVFIHGLGGHESETWMHNPKDHSSLWPVWLGEDTKCDAWTLGYDAAISGWQDAAMPLPRQGTSVLDRLVNQPELAGRRLLLIGHSMGGLVIKTAIVHGMTQGVARQRELVGRIAGVVFVATPHGGSDLANLAKAVGVLLRTNPQLGDMTLHNAHLLTLAQTFLAQWAPLGVPARVFAESKGVLLGRKLWGISLGRRVKVVQDTSSEPHLPGEVAVSLAEDHFSIAKPQTRSHDIHIALMRFVKDCAEAARAAPVAQPGAQATVPSVPPSAVQLSGAAEAADATAAGPPARLRGAQDNRLLPREGTLLGRTTEVAQVVAFLDSSADAAVVCAQVTGTGGIGKTEVCKAALREWLLRHPMQNAFYVEIPDTAGPNEFIDLLGRGIGAQGVATVDQLLPLLPNGLYYLDNLESLAELPEGQDLLRRLKDQPGVRVLASSRIALPGVLGQRLEIGVLPADAALALFKQLWARQQPLPVEAEVAGFIDTALGRHALSISLVARLGDFYSFEEVLRRWNEKGSALARDAGDQSRQGSLDLSLRLTSEALAREPGALALWTLSALFPDGIDEAALNHFEHAGAWSDVARQRLVRHHVLTLRDSRFHMLPPLARHALDAANSECAGFSWIAVRPLACSYFLALAQAADSIASTPQALAGRRALLTQFAAVHRYVIQESRSPQPDSAGLQSLDFRLGNQYQFRVALSVDMLPLIAEVVSRPASALWRLGDLERRLGQPEKARALYDRALKLFESEQVGLGQANVLQSLGDLMRSTGDFEAALALYQRALGLYASEQTPVGTAYTLAETARCLHALQRGIECDAVLLDADIAARASNTESVLRYVETVRREMAG